jgi:hypothetical protein
MGKGSRDLVQINSIQVAEPEALITDAKGRSPAAYRLSSLRIDRPEAGRGADECSRFAVITIRETRRRRNDRQCSQLGGDRAAQRLVECSLCSPREVGVVWKERTGINGQSRRSKQVGKHARRLASAPLALARHHRSRHKQLGALTKTYRYGPGSQE